MLGRIKEMFKGKVSPHVPILIGKAKKCRFSQPTTEMEFLPAALEVVETPPSPIGRATAWCIMILAVFLVGWASLGKTDVVAVAEGKIIPSGMVKIIQPLEGGVITSINVREGQTVKEGELLIELDTTTSGADVERLNGQLQASLLERGPAQGSSPLGSRKRKNARIGHPGGSGFNEYCSGKAIPPSGCEIPVSQAQGV